METYLTCLGTVGRKTVRTQTKQSVSPPLGIIQLDTGYHAANNFLSQPSYYIFEEQMTLTDHNQKFKTALYLVFGTPL